MQSNKRASSLILALAAVVILIAGFCVYLHYSLRHLDVSAFGAFLARVVPLVQLSASQAHTCGPPLQFTTPDEPETERTEVYVATVVDEYVRTFARLPDNIQELRRLPAFENADKVNGSQFTRGCYVQAFRDGSYLVGCNDSAAPVKAPDSPSRVAGVRGFIKAGHGEVLYMPRAGCS
jgi:hypothetical protein